MLLFEFVITVYLCLKHVAWKHISYQANKSDIGHTRLKEKQKKNTQTIFLPKHTDKEKKESKKLVTI